MADKPLFGPAGRADSFDAQGFRDMAQVPEYLAGFGLDAYEYQCGRGVRVNAKTLAAMKQNAQIWPVRYSIHAPYFISMSSLEEEKRTGSVRYVLESAAALRQLGGSRIIFHSGSCGKQSREQALQLALDTMRLFVQAMDENGYADMTLCPETMGKINQLGTLDEVLALCAVDKRITPCIDFGHLNARTQGGLAVKADYAAVLDRMADVLQDDRAKHFHAHFSMIEYTAGGEKQHLTFADTTFGPRYEPLMELLYERGLAPTVICESAGTQSEDAAAMSRYYAAL
ncbi:MAG: TIM barrel protein [Oscillospiraceae bacterium]|nr:TIM barrel protein [Oscillospiraceae bacterium]